MQSPRPNLGMLQGNRIFLLATREESEEDVPIGVALWGSLTNPIGYYGTHVTQNDSK